MALAKKHDQLPLDLGQLYAADITGAILAFLTHHGYTVWRQNNTGIYDAAKARWRVNPQSRCGVPDIIGFRNADGVFIGVEVKVGRDQLRDDQRTFLNELKAAHGLAFVAHDFAQFQQSFERRQGLSQGPLHSNP
ncbi:VRR-NUC domain-containing protein [Hymenobacter rubidus]|uniref:VRR-NUC domain-containing protein n=1 Tax=Hymenobacter rubidus TaxID=1441626 RepID=UPI00191FB67E|nr:VRR-NUC domain-containing protein [Hymenobacter rubidus]